MLTYILYSTARARGRGATVPLHDLDDGVIIEGEFRVVTESRSTKPAPQPAPSARSQPRP